MFTRYYENRSFGNSAIVNLIRTLSRMIDVDRHFGMLVSLIEKPYTRLIYPISLSMQEIAVAQVLSIVISFFTSMLIVWNSPVLGLLLFLAIPALIFVPAIWLKQKRAVQEMLVLMEIPVFLETFRIFLRHSRNTYSSFNAAIGSVRILAPYLSAISNNWGIDTDRYIDEMQRSIKADHIDTLCRILKNLSHKNSDEVIAYFEFHSNRINKYIEQLEQARINTKTLSSSALMVLPYVASLALIILPFTQQIIKLA